MSRRRGAGRSGASRGRTRSGHGHNPRSDVPRDESASDDSDDENPEEHLRLQMHLAQAMIRVEDDNNNGANDDDDNDDDDIPPTADLESTVSFPWMPVLYGLNRTVCGATVKSEKTARCIWAHWSKFCKGRSRLVHADPVDVTNLSPTTPVGLDLYRKESFTEFNSDENSFDKPLIGAFFTFLLSTSCTSNILTKAKTFLNAHLRAECKLRMMAVGNPNQDLGMAKVGCISSVKSCVEKALGETAQKSMDEFRDLHALLDRHMTDHEIRGKPLLNRTLLAHTATNVLTHIFVFLLSAAEMLESVFLPKAGGKVEQMDPINRINFGATFTASEQDVRRGDEHYCQFLVQRFLRRCRKIGSMPGTIMSGIITRFAKHNKYGRLEQMGTVPHVDAIRDAEAFFGLSLLFRIIVLGEKISFLDYKKLYAVASFRSTESGNTRIPKDTYRTNWRKFFEDSNVNVNKLTSIWRLQAFHEMDDDGVPDGHKARVSGHRSQQHDSSAAQRDCYQTMPSVQGMVSRACGDPKRPRAHSPAWRAYGEEKVCCESVMKQSPMLAYIFDERDQLEARCAQCASFKQEVDERLVTSLGTCEAAIHAMAAALQLLSARPVDPVTRVLEPSEPSWFTKYEFTSTTFHTLFADPMFKSSEWRTFQAGVRAAEDAASAYSGPMPEPARTEMGETRDLLMATMQQVETRMYHHLQQLQQVVLNTRQYPHEPSISNAAPATTSLARRAATGSTRAEAAQPNLPNVIAPLRAVDKVCKRNQGVNQELVLLAEVPAADGCPRLNLVGMDKNCTSARCYWKLWKDRFEPLEQKWQCRWRTDNPAVLATGGTKRRNQRCQWWNQRHVIWDVIATLIDHPHCLTEEEALAEAEQLYAKAIKDGKQKADVKKLAKIFGDKLSELGVNRRRGRPAGAESARTIARRQHAQQQRQPQQQHPPLQQHQPVLQQQQQRRPPFLSHRHPFLLQQTKQPPLRQQNQHQQPFLQQPQQQPEQPHVQYAGWQTQQPPLRQQQQQQYAGRQPCLQQQRFEDAFGPFVDQMDWTVEMNKRDVETNEEARREVMKVMAHEQRNRGIAHADGSVLFIQTPSGGSGIAPNHGNSSLLERHVYAEDLQTKLKVCPSKSKGRCSIARCMRFHIAPDHRCVTCGAGVHNLCGQDAGLCSAQDDLKMYCSNECKSARE